MFDAEFDFVVVGSGGGGMTGAITAHEYGLKTLLIEKTDKIGGTTSVSGGGVWIPNNHVFRRTKHPDNHREAVQYLNESLGPEKPATSMAVRAAYLESGPAMAGFLETAGLRWRAQYPYPDYYSDLPGGKTTGRSLEPEAFDMRQLGEWKDRVRADNSIPPLWLYNSEAKDFLMALRTPRGFYTAAKVVGLRNVWQKVTRKQMATTGKSLVAQLLKIVLDRGIPVWHSSPMLDVIQEEGRVVGVVVEREGRKMRIAVKRGVLLASGGFSLNKSLRDKFHEVPVDTTQSLVPEGADGDAYRITAELGAAMDQMDLAWWMPAFFDNQGLRGFNIWERSMPHAIVVDSSGKRFVSESAPYLEFGNAMVERNREVPAVPAWQIIDDEHRRSYPFTDMLPGVTPKEALTSGLLIKADSIEELATKIGIDPQALRNTVDRFNGFAKSGVDEDFNRGHNDYERHYGDPRCKPNPTLGTIAAPPFYASRLELGDIGTKGGAITDRDARVLREDDTEIPGLYAVGNATASVMGNFYPGAGATIGPSMVFAYRSAIAASVLAKSDVPVTR